MQLSDNLKDLEPYAEEICETLPTLIPHIDHLMNLLPKLVPLLSLIGLSKKASIPLLTFIWMHVCCRIVPHLPEIMNYYAVVIERLDDVMQFSDELILYMDKLVPHFHVRMKWCFLLFGLPVCICCSQTSYGAGVNARTRQSPHSAPSKSTLVPRLLQFCRRCKLSYKLQPLV